MINADEALELVNEMSAQQVLKSLEAHGLDLEEVLDMESLRALLVDELTWAESGEDPSNPGVLGGQDE